METATQQKMAERLSIVEGPIAATQARANQQPDDMKRLAEMLAARVSDAGKYAREHGQYVDGLSQDFAKQLLEQCRTYVGSVLAAEGRKTAELKRLFGNVERGPTSQG